MLLLSHYAVIKPLCPDLSPFSIPIKHERQQGKNVSVKLAISINTNYISPGIIVHIVR